MNPSGQIPESVAPLPGTQPNLSPLARLGLWSLAYFLAQELAFKCPDSFGLLSAIWPAAGIALAAPSTPAAAAMPSATGEQCGSCVHE